MSCNHIRAYEYFIDSIGYDNCMFIGIECDSWKNFVEGKCSRYVVQLHSKLYLAISIVYFYSCAEDMSNCGIMGFYAFSNLNGSIPKRHKSLFLYTDEQKPFCTIHHRVTIVLSDLIESKKQGGDRGKFRMVLHGENDSSLNLDLNKEETFFEPGRYV